MYTATIVQEDDMYVATCLDYDIASQGYSVEEALANLREAVQLYLDTAKTLANTIAKPVSIFVTNFTLSSRDASYSVA